MIVRSDPTTLQESEIFITLHLLFCRRQEKENLESSGKSLSFKLTEVLVVCSFTDEESGLL